jgi:hypothetical protein
MRVSDSIRNKMQKKTGLSMLRSAATLESEMGGSDWQRRGKAMQSFERDLKETVSDVKKEEYRREMRQAASLESLFSIEREVETDFQLTQSDRLQLLGEVHTLPRLRIDEKEGSQITGR